MHFKTSMETLLTHLFRFFTRSVHILIMLYFSVFDSDDSENKLPDLVDEDNFSQDQNLGTLIFLIDLDVKIVIVSLGSDPYIFIQLFLPDAN